MTQCYHNYGSIMKRLEFSWDRRKAGTNKQKHGVSFEEAQSVFYDGNARIIHDLDHSQDEDSSAPGYKPKVSHAGG